MLTARATGLPQLRKNSNFSHVYENARANAVGQIFNQVNTYSLTANLSQQIFQGGRIFAGARVASRLREAARMSEEETRARVSYDVQRSYLHSGKIEVESSAADGTTFTVRLPRHA